MIEAELPDGTILEFPDGTDKSVIQSVVKKRLSGAKAPAAAPAESPTSGKNLVGAALEPNLSLASGMIAAPASGLAGIAATVGNALGMTKADPGDVVRGIQGALTYQPRTEGGKNAMKVIGAPFEALADAADWAGGKTTDLTGSPLMGAKVNTLINAVPMALGARSTASVAPSTAVTNVAEAVSKSLMRSALKPDVKSNMRGQADRAVQTLLDEGINPTRSGAEKLSAIADDAASRVAQAIANSNAVVGKDSVLRRIDETAKSARNQVDPTADMAAVQRVSEGFANHPDLPLNAIPVQKAQEMKQGTYRQLADKYGEMGSMETEAQKALARGLKEEISREVPEVAPLNSRQAEILNALELVKRRAAVDANKNPMGLSLLSPSVGGLVGFLTDRSAAAKSMLARALNPGDAATIPADAAILAGAEGFGQDAKRRQALIDALMRQGAQQ